LTIKGFSFKKKLQQALMVDNQKKNETRENQGAIADAFPN